MNTDAMPDADAGSPTGVARRGEEIYREQHQAKLEEKHRGRYVAIDVETGQAYLGDTSGDALQKAREEAPHGAFHLMRVGQPAASRKSRHSSRQLAMGWR